ncbi:hypothetical protein NCAS_0H03640 [Naumovozyma castellii]|uniref:glutaminase n=1 Tax=Naumovozyma castellii TaxID=27288 RepID=G0VJJ4_NAUCA|nr:hypothetical protein NCAS_0H03640 [Naumovozyma castellii CBS 4309]CCC71674.1 hypothetical protein NCAS_0H03640 [Naumovozyma castellii CBS 4309]
MTRKKCVGVLALQGAFQEHIDFLERAALENCYNVTVIPVRTKKELHLCDSLVIPGGESTTMSLIAQRTNFFDDLYTFVHSSQKSVWGTCAGLIFISDELENQNELIKTLHLLHARVKRNAFGRQAQSFTKVCDFSEFIPECTDFPATFIRAPVIDKILDSETVKPLYTIPNNDEEDVIVAAQQGSNVLVTSFHPELADDDIRFHEWFLKKFVVDF